MRKINLRGITESLSEREMKLVKGGLDQPMVQPEDATTVETYCWQCTGSAKSCKGSFDGCLNAFSNACPAGGAFYKCIL